MCSRRHMIESLTGDACAITLTPFDVTTKPSMHIRSNASYTICSCKESSKKRRRQNWSLWESSLQSFRSKTTTWFNLPTMTHVNEDLTDTRNNACSNKFRRYLGGIALSGFAFHWLKQQLKHIVRNSTVLLYDEDRHKHNLFKAGSVCANEVDAINEEL